MRDESRYALWLNRFVGDDVSAYRRFLKEFGSEYEVFCAAQRKEKVASDEVLNTRMQDAADEGKIDKYLSWLKRHGIETVTIRDEEYPLRLREIYDPPTVLFYKGHLPDQDQVAIGVVGTRTNTRYGESVAKELSYDLASQGACVVSGLAYGIDAIAASAALLAEKNPCPTVAVLGSGVDVVYPKEHLDLYQKIAERGAVVSEFAPGEGPLPYHFPRRNRIISGFSHGVVVVEAGERSGAVITANLALDQGREVFAVPGRIKDPKSVGANRLIRDGLAKPVLTTNDILEEFDLSLIKEKAEEQIDFDALTEAEKRVVKLLQQDEYTFDELCHILNIDVKELNCALTSLEFSEIIKQSPGRIYGLAR